MSVRVCIQDCRCPQKPQPSDPLDLDSYAGVALEGNCSPLQEQCSISTAVSSSPHTELYLLFRVTGLADDPPAVDSVLSALFFNPAFLLTAFET